MESGGITVVLKLNQLSMNTHLFKLVQKSLNWNISPSFQF